LSLSSSARIAIVGCGHVGAVTAAGLAALGHQVRGIDTDPNVIAALSAGTSPFHEAGFSDLLAGELAGGRLRFTDSYEAGLANVDFIFLCVNTPATVSGAADLRHISSAVGSIGQQLIDARHVTVVNKSTAPIGTCQTIESLLTASFAVGERPCVAANPEFLREGTAVQDFFEPSRIVVGADDEAVARNVAALYAGIDSPVVLTALHTAELIKYVSNAFLAARVSLTNEVATLCEALDVDVGDVLRGISLDPRIGDHYLSPGIGYGGSCLPKDVAALRHTGESHGVSLRMLAAVEETNVAQRTAAVETLRRLLGGLEGRRIGVWGLTFKGGTDDMRQSAALEVVRLLRSEGAIVRAYDPSVQAGPNQALADEIVTDELEAARGAEALAILADWPCFKDVCLTDVRAVMEGNVLFDGRNQLSRKDAEAAGFVYQGVGRSACQDKPVGAVA